MLMKNDIDAIVDDLLISWHHHRHGYQHTRGYAGSDATCRDYKVPTHWDWQNGAMEDHVEKVRMKAVDVAVEGIPNTPRMWNTAIQVEARNLAKGFAVWSSYRLPQDPEELKTLRLEARNMLMRRLQSGGVIG